MSRTPHDDPRFPLEGMHGDEPPPPRVRSELPASRGEPHPVAWVVVAAGMLVATFYALRAVLGG